MSSRTEETIASALHDMAGQAAPSRVRIDAAWRVGRRRRLATIVTSTAGAAAIAVAVPLAVTSGPATHPSMAVPGLVGQSAAKQPGRALPEPIELRQVGSVSQPPCRAGSVAYSDAGLTVCLHLTGTAMTISRILSAHVIKNSGSSHFFAVHVLPGGDRAMHELTEKLASQHSPRNQVAIIVGGAVYSAPEVLKPVTGGVFQIVVVSAAQVHTLERDLGIH
jgi:hypothetical protein